MNNVLRWLVVGCLVLLAACATSTGSKTAPKIDPQAQAVTAYRIGVDDEVKVSVWQNEGLGVSVPVRPDGKISVPLVGDVDAGGRTPEEVAGEIQEKLKTFVRDPQVTVIVTQLRSHEYLSRVRVTGAVRSPVSVPYRQGMTVLDAVLAAGGTNEFAAADRTELYRKEGEATRAYAVQLDRILKNGELSTNYPVQPGDVITVPERTF
ncbi:MAG TPA: XrtA/PEP-CTERM system exopolysaccharide export protein [Rhodanobacteraceae bacterium]|nr:XrtA/PEP-CTERM system exopolysaccharide export protein [Rhodanobacteraceae bacterium]